MNIYLERFWKLLYYGLNIIAYQDVGKRNNTALMGDEKRLQPGIVYREHLGF